MILLHIFNHLTDFRCEADNFIVSLEVCPLVATSQSDSFYALLSRRTAKNNEINPIISTPPSISTDTPCNLSNSARGGSLAGVASTEPIWLRSTAILGIT